MLEVCTSSTINWKIGKIFGIVFENLFHYTHKITAFLKEWFQNAMINGGHNKKLTLLYSFALYVSSRVLGFQNAFNEKSKNILFRLS